MNRPRDSILNLFDPLFSTQPSTPPASCPSPDLGSDKENAPLGSSGDSPITLTKFFNRTYTRYKGQLPHPLPKGRLIDFGDPNVSYDDSPFDNDDDDDENENENDGHVPQEELHHDASDAQGTPQRRPLADIALGDNSSPMSIPKKSGGAAAVFGSPSSFRLARPTPAPSSSPLASVINAINGTTPKSPSPHITVTAAPAAPPSPSPTRRQLRPGATAYLVSPDVDERRISVDLQASLSVHFGESSFDLLKDKIMLPESDSLGDLEMDLELEEAVLGARASSEGSDFDAVPNARTASGSESDTDDVLSERLRDMGMASDDEEVDVKLGTLVFTGTKADNDDKDGITSTPPLKFTRQTLPTPPLAVRQFIQPRTNRLQAPTKPNAAPPVPVPAPAFARRSARASISALPAPTAALRITKKTNNKPTDVRKSALPPPPRTMFLGGVQRPAAHGKSASLSSVVPMRAPTAPQSRSAAASRPSLVAGPRPSGLRPPTSRAGSSGIVAPRASVATATGGAARLSMALGAGAGAGSRVVGSSSGMMRAVAGKSDGVRMMRRV